MPEIENENEVPSFWIVEINCRFCGNKTGEISVPRVNFEQQPTLEQVENVADSRCAACEVENGNFKQMSNFYERELELPYSEFKKDIEASDFKIGEFIKVCAMKNPEAVFGRTQPEPRIETEKWKIQTKLDMADLEPLEQAAALQHLVEAGKTIDSPDAAIFIAGKKEEIKGA